MRTAMKNNKRQIKSSRTPTGLLFHNGWLVELKSRYSQDGMLYTKYWVISLYYTGLFLHIYFNSISQLLSYAILLLFCPSFLFFCLESDLIGIQEKHILTVIFPAFPHSLPCRMLFATTWVCTSASWGWRTWREPCGPWTSRSTRSGDRQRCPGQYRTQFCIAL